MLFLMYLVFLGLFARSTWREANKLTLADLVVKNLLIF